LRKPLSILRSGSGRNLGNPWQSVKPNLAFAALETMPEDTSDRATKVYDVMKAAGVTSEDKMRDADAITNMARLPKGMVLSALQELESKGYAKRRAREKAAGYFLIR